MNKHKRERNELRDVVEEQRDDINLLLCRVQALQERAEAAESEAEDWRVGAQRFEDWRVGAQRFEDAYDAVEARLDDALSDRDALTQSARRYRSALQKIKSARNAAGHPAVERLRTLAREAIEGTP